MQRRLGGFPDTAWVGGWRRGWGGGARGQGRGEVRKGVGFLTKGILYYWWGHNWLWGTVKTTRDIFKPNKPEKKKSSQTRNINIKIKSETDSSLLPCTSSNSNPICRLCTTQHLESSCDSDNRSLSQNISALSFHTLTTACLGVWIISQTAYGDRLSGRRDKLSGSSSP